MSDKRKYDSTVARMAGNIAAGIIGAFKYGTFGPNELAELAVQHARAIVAETERTEPKALSPEREEPHRE